MATACCDALSACNDDAACSSCVKGTNSDACESTAETHERVDAFLTCRGGACVSACIGVAGSCKGALSGVVAATCQTCLEANCCEEVGSCKAKDACWNDCFTHHVEAACHADPDGHALFHALGSCIQSSCATECAAPSVDLVCADSRRRRRAWARASRSAIRSPAIRSRVRAAPAPDMLATSPMAGLPAIRLPTNKLFARRAARDRFAPQGPPVSPENAAATAALTPIAELPAHATPRSSKAAPGSA